MSSANGIKVMLVDDHSVVRRGLKEVLEDSGEFEVVSMAVDGIEAVRIAEESRPEVIIMDVLMPRKDGFEATREILTLLPNTKVLVLSALSDEDTVMKSVAAGATGFVPKYSGSEELVDAVRQVAAGRLIIPDNAVRRAFEMMRGDGERKASPSDLTNRERQVLALYATGKTYAEVADAIGIGMYSVRNTIYRIQSKLGLESKQEIVVWAAQNGLLDGGEA
ncbi:MAG: response regulator transcription factor [Chloroflexota bacterium]|nr:response regulator transcription factor [Dehalococcoidia bacterium]MDE2900791.1 response regulator transcription factor [Chloroflexota bacterium]